MGGSLDAAKIWMIVLAVILLVVIAMLVARKRSKGTYFGRGELVLESAGDPPHTHMASSSSAPLAVSSEDAGHSHLLSQGKDTGLAVTPAGHTHDITKFIRQKA